MFGYFRIIAALVCFLFLLSGCQSNSVSPTTPAAGSSPTITNFAPTSGQVGDTVTITGTNFSTTAANDIVSFNGTAAVVTSCTSTQIVVTIPASATTGPITVTVGGNRATSSSDFSLIGSLPSFAGYYKNTACYWTGTSRTDLPGDGIHGAWALSPTVSYGGKIYAAGWYSNGAKNIACYWTGTTRTDLGDGINSSWGFAIIVYNGTVYIAGMYNDLPCYWVGTTRTDLASNGNWGTAESIALYNGIVYTAGFCFGNGGGYFPCYWTGTSRTDLPIIDPTNHWGYAFSIAVYNGTIYTAGYYNNTPCYWTGISRTDLPDNGLSGRASSIAVSGGTVFTAGYYYDGTKQIPCYWTGTTRTDLSRGAFYDSTHFSNVNACAVTITVSGGTVYTAGVWCDKNIMDPNGISGTTIYMPCYWIGTTRTDLGDGNNVTQVLSSFSGSIYGSGTFFR